MKSIKNKIKEFRFSSINFKKLLNMKTLAITLMAIVGIALFSCNKTDEVAVSNQEILSKTTIASNDLSLFVQNYFEKQYQLMYGKEQLKSAQIENSVYSVYTTKDEADKHLESINWVKWGHDQTPDENKYVGYKIFTKIKDGTIKQNGNLITFQAYQYHELYFPSYNSQARKYEDFSAGVGLYQFTVEKQEQAYVVTKEEPVIYDGGLEGFEFEKTTEQVIDTTSNFSLKNALANSYSASRAVAFATKYYNNISGIRKDLYKNYYDYSDYGGDCTNFLSFCLLYGYWPQNDNWFFTSKGTCGNSIKKYSYSPSWTGAKYFYMYITSSKPTYPNSDGSKRVSSAFSNLKVPSNKDKSSMWTAFYDKIKLLKAGDILEIGDGGNPATITHNMIVTKVSTKSPYISLTYRNATGYGVPAINYAVTNISAGTRLYGFNVKSRF
jgi:hypothetical protein